MKKKIIKYSIVLVLLLSLIIFVLVQVLGSKAIYIKRPAYDKTGFVDSETLNQSEIILENNGYKFVLNTEDTNFDLLDKNTNQTWSSTPESTTSNIPADAKELFVLYYERKIEASKRFSVYDESIKFKNFDFRVKGNSIEVLYRVGGKHKIDYTDLPRKINVEDYNALILEPLQAKVKDGSVSRRDLSLLQSQFNLVPNEGMYYLKELTSQDSIDIMYDLVFTKSLYTIEKYYADALEYDFSTGEEIAYFEFSVLYELTLEGFKIKLINESILESQNYPIAYIDILPYFGVGTLNDNGFTVIPDGTGIFINHNNQKYNTVGYEKRVYGSDLSIGSGSEVKSNQGETLAYPMFGYQKNGYGFINIVTEGDAMSILRAGYLSQFVNGSYEQKIPYAHYRYQLRERDAFIFQSSSDSLRVTDWTLNYNTNDFEMNYQFINKAEVTYFDMAKAYQAYLVETYLLEKTMNEDLLHVTLLGGYLEKKYFLGFPFTSVESLTTKDGVLAIKNEIQKLGINNFNLTYSGFTNDGVLSTSYVKTHYNNNITTRKQLANLISELKNEDIDLFLEFAQMYASTEKDLNLDKNVVKNIFNDNVVSYPFSNATQLANKSASVTYIQNIDTSNKVITNVMNTLSKVDGTNVSFVDLGNKLASNLFKKDVMFRTDLINQQLQIMNRLDNKNVQLRNPNMYLAVKSNQILDLSMRGTMHSIVDYEIPFVPLVLNGYVNYAGKSINMDDSKSVQWHMLKAIETGANIQFTFTHENTTKLIKTDYNYLISTYYTYWMNDLNNIYQTINALGIQGREIVNHVVLNPQGSLVDVTYSGNLTIRINYETESYVVLT